MSTTRSTDGEGAERTADELRTRYLDLLKRVLTRSIIDDCYGTIPRNTKTPMRRARWLAYAAVQRLLTRWKLTIAHTARPTGETMIGMGALNNLEYCLRDVLLQDVPGDVCETGVWRGGACIFMRAMLNAMLKVYGDTQRKVWACDSFAGLPKPDADRYPADAGCRLWEHTLDVSLDEVKRNFAKYGLLDEQVVFLKGFFSNTIPTAPMERLALLRLDGDMYESTIVVLRHLYPRLSTGGYVIIDDYGMLPPCNQAVEDFRREHHVREELRIIGYVKGQPLGAYWQKAT